MKKFLANPTTALVLAVIVVLGTMFLETRVDFRKKCDAAKEQFYTRTDSEAPIADELREFCSSAEQLVLLGQRYEADAADSTYQHAEAVLDLLRIKSSDTGMIFDEYSELLSNTFALESSLTRADLNDADSALYSAAQHAAAEAKSAIDSASYNSEIQAFNKRYQRFPTPQLAALTGVEMPQLFA